MATWQFSVVLIPKSWAMEHQFDASPLYGSEGYDTALAWKDNQPNPEYKNILSTILPVANSWHKHLLCWGNTEEHDIQVWQENENIEGIHIRLDMNQSLNEIIRKVVDAAQNLHCVLFFPELKAIVDANEFELKNAALKSGAAKFVKDPKSYLDGIKNDT